MNIKTALRKNGGSFEKLSKTITTGKEAEFLVKSIRDQGLVNLVFYKSIMSILGKGITNVVSSEEGKKDPKLLEKVVEKQKQLTEVLISFPFLQEALFL